MAESELYTHLSGVFGPSQDAEDLKVDEVQEEWLWSKYLKVVKDYDIRVADNWKADADGVLVFAGLLSATVGIFIIESYKKLTPASGDQTVFLLGQISQQMAGFTNGNNTGIQPQSPPPFSPSLSAIYINAIWLLSLVLSTASAVLATMTRPWARRYTDLPQLPGVTRQRARVRSFLFLGTKRYPMDLTVEAALILLHFAVFLFYAGLVLFFFSISETVAMVVLVAVGIFGIVYVTLTLLPLLDHLCPYFTPVTSTLWSLRQLLPYLPLVVLRWFVRLLLKMGLRGRVPLLTRWLGLINVAYFMARQRVKDGIQTSTIIDALSRAHVIDAAALEWLLELPALTEQSEFEKLMAALPGETIIHLFNVSFEPGKPVFSYRLLDLLRSCAPGTVLLDENTYRRLSICMDVFHHIVRRSFVPLERRVLPDDYSLFKMRGKLANLDIMQELCAYGNPAIIRVTAHSIRALLHCHLLRGWATRRHAFSINGVGHTEWRWVRDVMGWPQDMVEMICNNSPTASSVNDMNDKNVDAFIYGVLSHPSQTEDFQIEYATSFKFTETLAILMNIEIHSLDSRQTFGDRLPALIRRLQRGNHEDRDNVVNKLREMFQGFLPHAPDIHGPVP